MIQYVTGFLLSPDHHTVALIRKNQPIKQRGKLNGVGGKIELGEDAYEAISREVLEEAAVHIPPSKWTAFVMISRLPEYTVTFLFAYSRKVFDVRSVEEERIELWSVRQLPDDVIWNLRWLIPLAEDPALTFENPLLFEESPNTSGLRR